MFLAVPSAAIELLSLHRAESNEFLEFFQLRIEQLIASSQHIINMKANHTTQHTCWLVQRESSKTHSLFPKPDLNEYFGNCLKPLARCIAQPKNSFQDEQQTARLNSLEQARSSVANSTRHDLCPEILPSRMMLAH